MKDMYTFDQDAEGALATYELVDRAYTAVFRALRLPFVRVEADTGQIGGSLSHEYHLLADVGEDAIVSCPACGFASNRWAGFLRHAPCRHMHRGPACRPAWSRRITPAAPACAQGVGGPTRRRCLPGRCGRPRRRWHGIMPRDAGGAPGHRGAQWCLRGAAPLAASLAHTRLTDWAPGCPPARPPACQGRPCVLPGQEVQRGVRRLLHGPRGRPPHG